MKCDQFWADVGPIVLFQKMHSNVFGVSGSGTAISYKDSSMFKIVILKKG